MTDCGSAVCLPLRTTRNASSDSTPTLQALLHLNPRVATSAKLRSTAAAQSAKRHWKRNSAKGGCDVITKALNRKVEVAREEHCEFLPFASPRRVVTRGGRICARGVCALGAAGGRPLGGG
ncbi:unnamed protein product [Lampetra fluviatilis]